jgi:sec-independent protein translocase protein TatA
MTGMTELLLVALVAVVLFAPSKLPNLARSLGSSLMEFKQAVGGKKKEEPSR